MTTIRRLWAILCCLSTMLRRLLALLFFVLGELCLGIAFLILGPNDHHWFQD